jgi:hypothetical protein
VLVWTNSISFEQAFYLCEAGEVPRKISAAYLRKLNEEHELAKSIAAKRVEKKVLPHDPDSGRLKGFEMICQTCGVRARFTVDKFGYATCGNCRAIANYRLGRPG